MKKNQQQVQQRIAQINGVRPITESIGDIKDERQAEREGVKIAGRCEWDGFLILALAGAALEDANFHTEAETVRKILKKLKG